jgi:phenylalanine-4-hydroxylase
MIFNSHQHQTWRILFERQIPNINRFACREFIDGFKVLGLSFERIPSLAKLNTKITPATGWKIVRTPVRYLSDVAWQQHLAQKQLPITNFIRTRKELNFTPKPDIFHDAFGHLPMLLSPELLQIINLFSSGYKTATRSDLPQIAQLWWNTIEFSLIREQKTVKVFGAGLMSSFGEIKHATKQSGKQAFTLKRGVQKPRAVNSFHPQFLVIESISKLLGQLSDFFSNQGGGIER